MKGSPVYAQLRTSNDINAPSKLARFSSRGGSRTVLHCAHSRYSPAIHYLTQQGYEKLSTAAVERGSSQGALREQRKLLTPLRSPSDCAASASKKGGSIPPPPICEGLEAACETRRTRASVARRPGGVDDGWLRRYCTSMVMVWLAASRSWSIVAPLTVIWCVPLLRPLNAPVKPR